MHTLRLDTTLLFGTYYRLLNDLKQQCSMKQNRGVADDSDKFISHPSVFIYQLGLTPYDENSELSPFQAFSVCASLRYVDTKSVSGRAVPIQDLDTVFVIPCATYAQRADDIGTSLCERDNA